MRAPTPDTPTDIDLISLLGRLRQRIARLLMASVVVGVLVYAGLSLIAPRYGAEAQLAIAAKSTNPFPEARERSSGSETANARLDKEAINTHVRALMAPDLLLRVADELGLAERAEFNPALGPVDTMGRLARLAGLNGVPAGETASERVLAAVLRRLEVAAARESRFISIRFNSVSPELSARFVNRLAETYRSRLVDVPVQETNSAVAALTPKIEQLKKEVIAADGEVERFRAKTDQFRAGPQATPVNDQRMASLTDELTRAEAARGEAQSRVRTAREMARRGGADVLPEVQRSAVVQNLIAERVRLERQIAEASAVLLASHPRMRQLRAELTGLNATIRAEVDKVVAGLEKDERAADLKVEDLARQIAALKAKVVDSSGDEAQLKALELAARSKRGELERLQRQLEDNRTLVVTRSVPIEAQIVSLARPSATPVFPKKGPYTLLAMAATLMLGLAGTATAEILRAGRPVVRTGRTAAADEPPRVGERRMAPAQPAAPRRAPVPASPPVASSQQAAIADVAASLLARHQQPGGVRSMIVGAVDEIDASPVGLAVARALTTGGLPVVLVDWALDGGGFAPSLGLAARPGLTDLLTGRATFEQCVRRLAGSEAHFIAAGAGLAATRQGAENATLDPDALNLILDVLDEIYAQIVIVGRESDCALLFEAIQGRIDAGITVYGVDPPDVAPETFLGFDVIEMDLFAVPGAGALPAPTTAARARRPSFVADDAPIGA